MARWRLAARRRAVAVLAAAAITGSLLGPARASAVDCQATLHKCSVILGTTEVAGCYPEGWECCNVTGKCQAACAPWQRCMNGGTDFAVCEETAALCTLTPLVSKFCEEPIMTTGVCGGSVAGNIGWCCLSGALCGEHATDCICPVPCGAKCCKAEEECFGEDCKMPCPPGLHYDINQNCVCDTGPACGLGSRRMCCPDGAICQHNRCVTPREPENPDSNFLQNMINMINQVSGAHSGRNVRARLARGSVAAPVGAALLQLAAVNGLRAAAGLAFSDHPVDPAYQSKVVAAKGSLPALASGPGLEARAATALGALLAAQASGFTQALASAKSLARARGALSQDDVKQAGRQARSAAGFAGRAAKALRRVPKLRAQAVAALTSTGAGEVNLSAEEVAALQASVESGGVPADMAELLAGLGADGDDLDRVRRSLLTASTGGPALIAPLADAAQTADLQAMAKALGRFSKSARRSPFGTIPGAL